MGPSFYQTLRPRLYGRRDIRRRDIRAEAQLQPRTGRGRYWSPEEVYVNRRRAGGSKVERMVTHLPAIERGRVRFRRTAPWWSDYARELLSFSESSRGHDDQVDSTSLALTRGLRPHASLSGSAQTT